MLDELATRIRDINKANGWNVVEPADWNGSEDKIPAKLALLHSEVSEALEAFRKNDRGNFLEELADTLIRTLDIAGGLTDDFGECVAAKLEVNKGRGFRHGGKRC